MQTTRITRSALALAAIALATAGYSAERDADTKPAKVMGIPPVWGLDPNRDAQSQGLTTPFNPRVLTIVRISAQGTWGLFVNYASFALAEGADPATEAGKIANVVKAGAGASYRFGQNRAQFKALGIDMIERKGPPTPGAFDVDSFADLGANQQTATIIWVDIPGASLVPNELISFTPYDANGGRNCAKLPSGIEPAIVENDSFIATPVTTTPQFRNRPVMLVRNYFTKPGPKEDTYEPRTPTDTPVCYSMNIQFQIGNGAGKTIPIAIDPNTGNGAGYEP